MIASDTAWLNPEMLVAGVSTVGLPQMLGQVVGRVIYRIRYRHLIWVVLIKPQTRWGHGMVRVWERRRGEERSLLSDGVLNERDGPVSDEAG